VNSCHALNRQRLTAAHELGHYLLGTRHEGSGVFESNTEGMGGEEGEREAFSFARHFLMDEQGLRGLVASIADERERVAASAGTYVVSVNVAAIHLAELGLIRPATKRALLEDLRSKQITPSGFLRTHGYRLPWTPEEPEPVLDPQHVGRALQAYRNGWLTLIALADSLQLEIRAAVDLLTETGIPLDEDDVATATHSARP
jgi:hypothetical protein